MKSTYSSKYTDRKVTAAQKMAEIMCENLARKEHSALPFKFWNTPKWEKHYKIQLFAANGLLKLYSAEAIFRGLRDKRASNIYSLNAPFVIDELFQNEQKRIDREAVELANNPAPEEKVVTTEKPRQTFISKKSILSKLKGLDDGEGQEADKREGT